MSIDLDWIVAGLAKPGKTKGGLAAALGRSASAVTAMLAGQRQLKAREIPVIAAYLEVDPPGAQGDLIKVPSQSLVPVRVQGAVEAGSWREVDAFDDVQDEMTYDTRDLEFPHARLMANDIAGDSMNDLKPRPILPGDRVISVVFEDLRGRVPLRDGMVLIIEQRTAGGDMRERSIKQLELFEDHYEFHPRSTNAKHKPIVVDRDFTADDGRTVEVIGLVRKVMNTIPIS
ncbi:LexA family protein [Ancylobacter radicis]|uniref:Peptidase S24 n=1 Tax=Ancylobacter radicis TaxID=2836179 RepID=A0ABS5R5P1_9HYPH|nr:peptidase S24 [Ancylobacter radicis]MBS9476206.1 peptidase S24 [Ancylobacter radicis]